MTATTLQTLFPLILALLPGASAHEALETPSPDIHTLRSRTCPEELVGAWSGTLDVDRLFDVHLTISEPRDGDLAARVRIGGDVEAMRGWRQGERTRFQPRSRLLAFDVVGPDGEDGLDVFVHFARFISHVRLPREPDGTWTVGWNHLKPDPGPVRLDLYVDDDGHGGTAGYFFFRDPRLPALFGEGVVCGDGGIRTRERNLGLELEGPLEVDGDSLPMTASALGGEVPIVFRRMTDDEVPELPDASIVPPRAPDAPLYTEHAPRSGGGWDTARPSEAGLDPDAIAAMVRAIVQREITATHAVLVARHGRLVVEEYFYGYDEDTPHDLRSASKTFGSTLVGLAIRDGLLESASTPALRHLDYRIYANWDPRKARITLRDLMTMSSGLDANDYDPGSVASEGAYQSQRRDPDWVKVALDAPMIRDPGVQPLYGGANPLVLGGVLQAVSDEPLEWFAHRRLFGPLGITDYRWFTVPTGEPYFGGGMYLRPRDVLKIGQLYLDGGAWKGERIVSEAWVRDSWDRYGRLAPLDVNGHEYGYLWWHHLYDVGGRTLESVEARGYGGQYLFVVPELDLVAVITAGNYRNGRTRQSEDVLSRFVLSAVR